MITSHPNTELGYADPSESSASICYLPRSGAPSASNIYKVRSNLQAAFKHLLALSTPMKLYSAHGCCCFLCAIVPNRTVDPAPLLEMHHQYAAAPRVLMHLRNGVTDGRNEGLSYVVCPRRVFWADAFYLLASLSFTILSLLPLQAAPFTSSCSNLSLLFSISAAHTSVMLLLRSAYTGSLTQSHLTCSYSPSSPASSRLSRNFLQLQIHTPRHHPSGPMRSHFNRTHHRERVGLSFVCNNDGPWPTHVEKIRGGGGHEQ